MTKRALNWVLSIGALVHCMSFPANGAPLTFNSALPVARGESVVREIIAVERLSRTTADLKRKAKNWSATSVLGFGVTPDLAIFGVVPFVSKNLRLDDNDSLTTRQASGFGDARLFARYTLFKRNWIGRTLRVAPFFGMELPTGADSKTDGLGRLAPAVQPGSGSWDPFGGIVISYQTLDFEVDAEVSYKINSKANNFEFGDVLRLDAALQYRIWPGEVVSGTNAFVYSILEIGLVHVAKAREAGLVSADSGGTSLFIMPGLQYAARRWVLEAGIQFPIAQDLGSAAMAQDLVFRGGIRFNF